MNILRTIMTELVGLFVDDWAFAFGIVAWLALMFFAGPRLPPAVAAPVFFLGLAVLTLASALQRARKN